jgi:hypothetical protein
MALFTTALGLYGGVLWSGELQGSTIHQMVPSLGAQSAKYKGQRAVYVSGEIINYFELSESGKHSEGPLQAISRPWAHGASTD